MARKPLFLRGWEVLVLENSIPRNLPEQGIRKDELPKVAKDANVTWEYVFALVCGVVISVTLGQTGNLLLIVVWEVFKDLTKLKE